MLAGFDTNRNKNKCIERSVNEGKDGEESMGQEGSGDGRGAETTITKNKESKNVIPAFNLARDIVSQTKLVYSSGERGGGRQNGDRK